MSSVDKQINKFFTELPKEADQTMLVLRLANGLVENTGFSVFGNERKENIADIDALALLGLSAEDASTICDDVGKVMAGASKHF